MVTLWLSIPKAGRDFSVGITRPRPRAVPDPGRTTPSRATAGNVRRMTSSFHEGGARLSRPSDDPEGPPDCPGRPPLRLLHTGRASDNPARGPGCGESGRVRAQP